MTAAALVAAQESQHVTNWPARLGLTLAVLLGVAAVGWLMLRGWRHRAGRQADLPPLPARPDRLGRPLVEPVEGVYVSSTTAGDWLDRIVARGLGVPSDATVQVTPEGVWLDRVGAPGVFVPVAALRGAHTAQGMAGKVVERDGLVVLTWQLGDRLLDTGFRPRRAAEAGPLLAAVEGLAGEGRAS